MTSAPAVHLHRRAYLHTRTRAAGSHLSPRYPALGRLSTTTDRLCSPLIWSFVFVFGGNGGLGGRGFLTQPEEAMKILPSRGLSELSVTSTAARTADAQDTSASSLGPGLSGGYSRRDGQCPWESRLSHGCLQGCVGCGEPPHTWNKQLRLGEKALQTRTSATAKTEQSPGGGA